MSQVLQFMIQVIADIPDEPDGGADGNTSSKVWLIVALAVVVVAAALAAYAIIRRRKGSE